MRDVIIYGAGGFGNEVAWMVNDCNNSGDIKWNILGFVDDNPNLLYSELNGINVVGNLNYLLNCKSDLDVIVSINNPKFRMDIIEKISVNSLIRFPNLIHPAAKVYPKAELGVGNIIGMFCIISCNVTIGNFNIINSSSVLGHDVTVGNFNTLNPKVGISGKVEIKDLNEFGMSSSVVPGKKIGTGNKLGAHSLLLVGLGNDAFFFGSPALSNSL